MIFLVLLIKLLPGILGHKPKHAKERPAKVVKIGVIIVRIPFGVCAFKIFRTGTVTHPGTTHSEFRGSFLFKTIFIKVTDILTVLMDTSLVQTSLEELLTYQGEDAEAKESQNHHINKLLHRAQQGPNNDLQT